MCLKMDVKDNSKLTLFQTSSKQTSTKVHQQPDFRGDSDERNRHKQGHR
jgi:hypothetical protein